MTEQLSFDLPVRTARGREDFLVSDANALALAQLDTWAQWSPAKLLLIGPKRSGKSHLAAIWAQASNAISLDPRHDFALPPAGQAVVVEDLQSWAGNAQAETNMFHLHNHLAATGGHLLITSTLAPAQAGIALPDLLSRLQASPLTHIGPPDDALLGAVMLKHFADRQLMPPASVIPYLVTHMSRSFDMAATVVARLDQMGLSRKKPITRAMAAEVLGQLACDP